MNKSFLFQVSQHVSRSQHCRLTNVRGQSVQWRHCNDWETAPTVTSPAHVTQTGDGNLGLELRVPHVQTRVFLESSSVSNTMMPCYAIPDCRLSVQAGTPPCRYVGRCTVWSPGAQASESYRQCLSFSKPPRYGGQGERCIGLPGRSEAH